jgi:hypothetical protein
LIKQSEPFVSIVWQALLRCWNHTDCLAGLQPVDIIAGMDIVLIGDSLWDGDLVLGGDFRHSLTLARMTSLQRQTQSTYRHLVLSRDDSRIDDLTGCPHEFDVPAFLANFDGTQPLQVVGCFHGRAAA